MAFARLHTALSVKGDLNTLLCCLNSTAGAKTLFLGYRFCIRINTFFQHDYQIPKVLEISQLPQECAIIGAGGQCGSEYLHKTCGILVYVRRKYWKIRMLPFQFPRIF